MPEIPRYKRGPINAQTEVEKLGGMADEAAAKGQARVAQEQKGYAQTQGQRANMEVVSMAQRLNDFSNALNSTMGQVAKHQGVEEANNKSLKHKDNIQKIKSDTSLTYEQKLERIGKEETQLSDDYTSIYGQAYNNAVEANYNNEIVIRAQEAAVEASNASNGSPLQFRDAFTKYSEEATKSAPSAASELSARRAFDKAGISEYKSLYNKNQKEFNKNARSSYEIAFKNLENIYYNQIERGDIDGAVSSKAQMVASTESALDNEYIDKPKAIDRINSILPKAQQVIAEKDFKEDLEAGVGVDNFKRMQQRFINGELDNWKAKTASTMLKQMEAGLRDRGNPFVDDLITLYEDGRTPSAIDIAEAETYLPYLSEAKTKSFLQASTTSQVLQSIEKESYPEQLRIIQKEQSKDGIDATAYKAFGRAAEITKQRIAETKTNPLVAGAKDLKYEIKTLTPGTLTMENIAERYNQSSTAKNEFGTTRQFFTQEELPAFVAYVEDPTTSIQDKLMLISKIEQGTKGNSDAAFNQLSKKKASVFAGAAGMVSEGRQLVGESILRGDRLIKEGAVTAKKTVTSMQISKTMKNFFKYTGQGDVEKITDSVEALAATYAVESGMKAAGELRTKDVKKAIETIMGDSTKSKSGHTFFAEQGTDAGDVKDYFNDLDSTSGIPELQMVKPGLEAEYIQKSDPVHTGNGEYVFFFDGKIVRNTDGTPYKMKYKSK